MRHLADEPGTTCRQYLDGTASFLDHVDFGVQKSQVLLYPAACATSRPGTVTTSGGQVTLNVSGAT